MEADEKACPACAETIKAAAIKCRYCGEVLPESKPAYVPELEPVAEPMEFHPAKPLEAPKMNTAGAVGGGAAGAATGGCLAAGMGLWVGVFMCAIGGLACLTGIGAIIGIPFILGGIMVPILAGVLGGAAGGAVGMGAGAQAGLTESQKANLSQTGFAKESNALTQPAPPWVGGVLLVGFLIFAIWLAAQF